MSGPRIFFTGIVLYVVFSFPRAFFVFGSGSFYRLLGPPKTKNPRGKPKKTKKPKKPKKTKDSQECLGQGLCSEALVFLVFFGFPRVFLIFGSGSFYRLLGPPKTKKPRGKPKKTKKTKKPKKPMPLNKVLGPDIPENPLFFLVF